MTLMQAVQPVSPAVPVRLGTREARRFIRGPVGGTIHEPVTGRGRLATSRRVRPSRPAVAPLSYRGTGVALSATAHRRRPASVATTVGLTLLAAIITLWLGLVAHFGEMANGAPPMCHPSHRACRTGSRWSGWTRGSRCRTWRLESLRTRRFDRSSSASGN